MSSAGYVTGEYLPTEVKFASGPEPTFEKADDSQANTANEIVSGSDGDSQIVRVCCRLGRYIIYGKDKSIKNWKSVYLKITHPTTTDANVSFKVEAVENSGTNTSEETYIMLYGPAPGGGLIDYRNVPVLPIYE